MKYLKYILLVSLMMHLCVSPQAIKNRFFWVNNRPNGFINYGLSASMNVDTSKFSYFVFYMASW